MMGYKIEFYAYLPNVYIKIYIFSFRIEVRSGTGPGSDFFSSDQAQLKKKILDPDPTLIRNENKIYLYFR